MVPVDAEGFVRLDLRLAGGKIAELAPAGSAADGVDLDGGQVWPGLVDAHVHLAFGPVSGGVVGVRDLGAPPGARGAGCCAAAGPIITAPGGYPSTTWGREGFARGVGTSEGARRLVADLVADGVELIKIAIEPTGGLPTPWTVAGDRVDGGAQTSPPNPAHPRGRGGLRRDGGLARPLRWGPASCSPPP